jgi:ribosomal protein L19E
VNELNSIALTMVVSMIAEERHKPKCREMKNKFKKREKGCGSINGRRKKRKSNEEKWQNASALIRLMLGRSSHSLPLGRGSVRSY